MRCNMGNDLLATLMEMTEEEKMILEQSSEIKKDLYTNQTSFIIESEKFLNPNEMIMLRKHTRFIDFPKHRHNYIEINYVFHGELMQKVGTENVHLKQGELLFLNQHIEHEIEACAKEDIIINFIIQPKFFDFIFSYLSSTNLMSNFIINSLYNHTQNGQYLYFAVTDVVVIQELIKKMMDEIMEPSLFSESTLKLYMGLLMIELLKHTDKLKQNELSTEHHYMLVETMKYIDEHYQNASLYALAEQLNQPHYAVSKQIKQATKYTFKELLQEKRLTKAKEFLERTEMPIIKIIDEVGYDNMSYFYRIFKSKYGKTPKDYRMELKGR